jgi:hypothetical protein
VLKILSQADPHAPAARYRMTMEYRMSFAGSVLVGD